MRQPQRGPRPARRHRRRVRRALPAPPECAKCALPSPTSAEEPSRGTVRVLRAPDRHMETPERIRSDE
ncbi:hypothetical protein DUI70_0001 [Streptomyces albus]|nr:hypothetical protein DUI70_0001 [Streptomyces albus]